MASGQDLVVDKMKVGEEIDKSEAAATNKTARPKSCVSRKVVAFALVLVVVAFVVWLCVWLSNRHETKTKRDENDEEYCMKKFDDGGEGFIFRHKDCSGLFYRNASVIMRKDENATFIWDRETGELRQCISVSTEDRSRLLDLSKHSFATQDDSNSIFDLAHPIPGHLDEVPPAPSIAECVEANRRAHGVDVNENVTRVNETARAFRRNVTTSRNLLVVGDVVYRGPLVDSKKTTAIHVAGDLLTVLNDARSLSDIHQASVGESRRLTTPSWGDLWKLAKAAYFNAFWWSDTDPPSGFALLEVFIHNTAEAKLFCDGEICILAVAGTHPLEINDYFYSLDWDRVSYANKIIPEGFRDYVREIDGLIEESHYFRNISMVVGHSLGGTAAVYLAAKYNWTAVTFGAPKTTHDEQCSVDGTRIYAADDPVCSDGDGVDWILGDMDFFNHDVSDARVLEPVEYCSFYCLFFCCPWAVETIYTLRNAQTCAAVSGGCDNIFQCALNLDAHAWAYDAL
mmetsp:Transcript_21014/g.66008  ORF Transcript_21014/g.66008 Transcript_21014/m.66008 type:complete len:512 (-) Transcript_21014:440-1975(-)